MRFSGWLLLYSFFSSLLFLSPVLPFSSVDERAKALHFSHLFSRGSQTLGYGPNAFFFQIFCLAPPLLVFFPWVVIHDLLNKQIRSYCICFRVRWHKVSFNHLGGTVESNAGLKGTYFVVWFYYTTTLQSNIYFIQVTLCALRFEKKHLLQMTTHTDT
jgi:hypothetical protein